MIKGTIIKAKENAPCDCNRGRFVVPNDWWRNELKLVRCNWCHATAMLVEGGIVDRMRQTYKPEDEKGILED